MTTESPTGAPTADAAIAAVITELDNATQALRAAEDAAGQARVRFHLAVRAANAGGKLLPGAEIGRRTGYSTAWITRLLRNTP